MSEPSMTIPAEEAGNSAGGASNIANVGDVNSQQIQSTSVSVNTASQYTQQSERDIPETTANDAVAKAMEPANKSLIGAPCENQLPGTPSLQTEFPLLAPTSLSNNTGDDISEAHSRSASPTKTMRKLFPKKSSDGNGGEGSSTDPARAASPTKRGLLSRIGGGIRDGIAAVKSNRGHDSSRSRFTSGVPDITNDSGVDRGRTHYRDENNPRGVFACNLPVESDHVRSKSIPPGENEDHERTNARKSSSTDVPRDHSGTQTNQSQPSIPEDYNLRHGSIGDIDSAGAHAFPAHAAQNGMASSHQVAQELPFRQFSPQSGYITEQQVRVVDEPSGIATADGSYLHSSSGPSNTMGHVRMQPYDMHGMVGSGSGRIGMEDLFRNRFSSPEAMRAAFGAAAEAEYDSELNQVGIAERQEALRVRFAVEANSSSDRNIGDGTGSSHTQGQRSQTGNAILRNVDGNIDRDHSVVVSEESRMVRSETADNILVGNQRANTQLRTSVTFNTEATRSARSAMRGGRAASVTGNAPPIPLMSRQRRSRSTDAMDTRARLMLSLIRNLDDGEMSKEEFLANVERLMFGFSNIHAPQI